MIAAALRTQIDNFCHRTLERSEVDVLARCALATQRLTLGMRPGVAENALPSMQTLGELVEGAMRRRPAAFLAYRAVTEQLLARVTPSAPPSAACEEALDTIDDLVEDPAELPVLREALGAFCERFHCLCQEASRAPRKLPELAASAA